MEGRTFWLVMFWLAEERERETGAMGGSSAIRAESGARIFQALSRRAALRGATRAFYAASQALGRYWIARGLAGPQHGAAEDRRIYDPDRSDPGRALRRADGSRDGGLAQIGGARGEPRAIAAHRLDPALARAFRSFRSGHAAQFGARRHGGGDREIHQRSAARPALSKRAGSGLGRARPRGSAFDSGHSREALGRAAAYPTCIAATTGI